MKTDRTVIRVENVYKDFILPQHRKRSIKQLFLGLFSRTKPVRQRVLEGVGFSIREGDFFGIVGRNGSGKSTLLKILAGVYYPTSGEVQINGRLTPFIELGVGFNPELTARDNVYLNGALLGFTRKQMHGMYDEIVHFAELGPFMEQKLKNFSSGMQVRLAFSIAIKARNDVLIFDEVLAVGDEAFQRKCYDVFDSYKATGQTVVLVSHDMSAIKNFCNRAILLHEGKIIEEGEPERVAATYSKLNQQSKDVDTAEKNALSEVAQKQSILVVKTKNEEGKSAQSFFSGETAYFTLDIKEAAKLQFESVGLTLIRQSGEHIGGLNSRIYRGGLRWKESGKLTLKVNLDVMPGKYYVLAELFSKPGKLIESYKGALFEVKPSELDWSGLTKLRAEWIKELK